MGAEQSLRERSAVVGEMTLDGTDQTAGIDNVVEVQSLTKAEADQRGDQRHG